MSRRRERSFGPRAAMLCAASTVLFGAAAPPAGAAAAERVRPAVEVATTGTHSELRRTVPIARRRDRAPRIAMSIGPGGIPSLRRDDRLEVSSEVQITVDCTEHEPRCAGRPYRFDPTVIVRLEIARRRSVKARSTTLARRKLHCGQSEPLRQHHCPVVFGDVAMRVGERFPCPPQRCFLNLVVSAHSRKARGGERIIIGSNKPNGRIVQNKSRINLVRLAPGVRVERLRSRGPLRRSTPLRPQKRVILSRRVEGLDRGDALAAAATIRSNTRHLGYSALVGGELIAARARRATSPNRRVRRSVSHRGILSPINGTNCTPQHSPCATKKVGVLAIRRQIRNRAGKPAPLFINLVMRTKPKRVGPRPHDRLRLRRSGGIEVRRYSP